MRLRARIATSVLVTSALLLPGAVALATTLHALEHGRVPAGNHELAALAAHGHTHPVATPPHDHGATFGAGKPTLSPPAAVAYELEVDAPARHHAWLPVPAPRSRGSGGDLVLALSCVLLI